MERCRSASSELHCPRCSALVHASPGVCENCGENVFQCVKCRAINYDEKEPFLCQACGFCQSFFFLQLLGKFARIETHVTGRPLPSLHPIHNDVDRANVRFPLNEEFFSERRDGGQAAQ